MQITSPVYLTFTYGRISIFIHAQSFALYTEDMKTQIIYLIVGGRVRPAQARIVGKLAEVRTEYGIREFGVFYLSAEEAQEAIKAKKSKGKEGNVQDNRPDAVLSPKGPS